MEDLENENDGNVRRDNTEKSEHTFYRANDQLTDPGHSMLFCLDEKEGAHSLDERAHSQSARQKPTYGSTEPSLKSYARKKR